MYTTANWRPVAASAMGANSTIRCIMAAAFPLFAVQMVHCLSSADAIGLLAGLNCLMVSAIIYLLHVRNLIQPSMSRQIPVPFVLTRYGTQIRAKSRYTLKT